jgi:hypothetical protein
MNPVLTLNPTVFNVRFNSIVPFMPRSSKWLLPSDFTTKTLYGFHTSPMRATCPARLTFHDLITLIMSGEEYKLWSSLRSNADHANAGLYEYPFCRRATRLHLAQYQILDNLTCPRSECETCARSAMKRPRRHVTSLPQLSRGSIQSDLTQDTTCISLPTSFQLLDK